MAKPWTPERRARAVARAAVEAALLNNAWCRLTVCAMQLSARHEPLTPSETTLLAEILTALHISSGKDSTNDQ